MNNGVKKYIVILVRLAQLNAKLKAFKAELILKVVIATNKIATI